MKPTYYNSNIQNPILLPDFDKLCNWKNLNDFKCYNIATSCTYIHSNNLLINTKFILFQYTNEYWEMERHFLDGLYLWRYLTFKRFGPCNAPYNIFNCLLGQCGQLSPDLCLYFEARNSWYDYQGSYRSWKSWKFLEFKKLFSKSGKSGNSDEGPGKSWQFELG